MKTVCGEREQPPNTPSFLTQPKVILDDEHTAQTPALQAVVLLTGCVVWGQGGQSQCPLPCSSMWTLPLPTYRQSPQPQHSLLVSFSGNYALSKEAKQQP